VKEQYYKIASFNLGSALEKLDPTELQKLMDDAEVRKIIAEVQMRYLSWQEFRNKDWASHKKEKIWALVKMQRSFGGVKSGIVDQNGREFMFNPRAYTEFLHYIDLELGGSFMGIGGLNDGDKRWFIRRNLIEESIASSQLEGANTSRKAARMMLEEGRKPRDKSEQMIVNNHEVMKWIEEELKNHELSMDNLKELHRRITFNTIDQVHQGVLRETLDREGNPLVVKPFDESTIAYVVPAKEFVEKEIKKFIEFANDKKSDQFIHPLIKAIMLHFWIGLLHPFEDGNGRLARIVFYWYMLRKKYWAFSYLSISERILKSQKDYAMAYINSEQDDNDLNYFIHYNVSKIKLARQHFQEYISQKISDNKRVNETIRKNYQLNQRQLRLLHNLSKGEQEFTSVQSYSLANSEIKRLSAILDLKKLVEQGFLSKVRNGRNIYYHPTGKIDELFS
jgi:Fic family protein